MTTERCSSSSGLSPFAARRAGRKVGGVKEMDNFIGKTHSGQESAKILQGVEVKTGFFRHLPLGAFRR